MGRIKNFFIPTSLEPVIIFLETGSQELFLRRHERLFLILLRGMAL
jgi:hypothetical protein